MRARAALLAAALLMPALSAVLAATTAAAPGLDELMQLFAARRHGHAPFTEVHNLAMLKEPLRSSGELFYDAPDHLEKRTLLPRRESLVLEHGVITAQRGQRTRVLPLSDYPQVVPFVESIRATLAGDKAALEQYFVIDFSGDTAHWTLGLKPKDAARAGGVAAITISGAGALIATIAIRQNDGDDSLMTIGPEITP